MKRSLTDKLAFVTAPSLVKLGTIQNTIPDLQRILALPRRIPYVCERDENGLYPAATQALIEVETEKFSRTPGGKRLSCGCRPRKIIYGADGTLTIFRVLPENYPPEPPVRTSKAEFVKDCNALVDGALIRKVSEMQPGQEIDVPAVDGELGNDCIVELAPAQAWFLREAAQEGGVVGFCGVGSGKCLHGDSEIFDLQAGRRRLVRESGTLSVSTLNGSEITSRPAAAFASGQKYCCRLVIADGSELRLSLDHQVLTQRGWVQAHELTTQDFVCVPTKFPQPEQETVATDEEIAMVAFLLADGGCSQRSVFFTNETPSVIEEFKRLAPIVANGLVEILPQKSKARAFRLIGSHDRKNHKGGSDGTGFRKKWGLYGLSKEKRVKAEIWGLPKTQIALFINRFWACDGHISKLELECTLASEKLIDDLRFLLLRIGVRSRKRFKLARCEGSEFTAWRISISGADALTFLNVVGDVLGKEEACQRLRDRLTRTKRNTNFDIVPIGRPELYEICDELEMPRGTGRRKKGQLKRPSDRTDLIRGYFKATAGQYVSRERFVAFCEKYRYQGKYKHLGSADVAWERVVSVDEIGLQDVFDLTVPDTKNFVANGMIVHNSIAFLLSALLFSDSRLAVLLIEPKQRQHYKSEYIRLREHFRVSSIVSDVDIPSSTVPGTTPLHLISYSVLSRTDNSDMLDIKRPDVLMLDEAHRACGTSAINRRVKRYVTSQIRAREESIARGEPVRDRAVRLLDASGTLEVKSINDTQMLCAYSLGTGSPVPLDPNEAEAWSAVIDNSYSPDRKSATARALHHHFGNGYVETDETAIETLLFDPPEKDLREGYQKWRSETPGIISATASDINASLYLGKFELPKMPKVVADALTKVRVNWERPDGEEFIEKIEQLACAKNVACGFYPYWAFPKHPCTCPPDRTKGRSDNWCEQCCLIDDWYLHRKNYNRALRKRLELGEVRLDSPALCEEAARRAWALPVRDVETYCATCFEEKKGEIVKWPCLEPGHLPAWHEDTWPGWEAIMNRVEYEERVKWIGCECVGTCKGCAVSKDPDTHPGYWLAREMAKWGKKNKGVIWFQSVALGRKISELSGLPYFNGGPGGEARLRAEKGNRSIICSISAHGAGTNGLQELFDEQVVAEVPPSNATTHGWEQIFGRLHRRGQKSDEVSTLAALPSWEFLDALRKAIDGARFNYHMTGNRQKLLLADIDIPEL